MLQILRLYFGEITGLVLVLILFFVAAAIASRYYHRSIVRRIRNLSSAIAVAIFAGSLTYSVMINQIPRRQIDRSSADQDQKSSNSAPRPSDGSTADKGAHHENSIDIPY